MFVPSDEKKAWLAENFNKHTYAVLAKEVGCSVDTLKKLLAEMGLRTFKSIKHQPRVSATKKEDKASEDWDIKEKKGYKHWNRPCIQCGCKLYRPKNQYICDACKKGENHDSNSATNSRG